MDPKYRIYLLTKGRLGKQKTLKYLSTEVMQNLTVVVPKSELKEHKKAFYGKHVDFLTTKDSLLLPNKRNFVFEHHRKQGGLYAMVLEDDLLFYGMHKGSYIGATKSVNTADKWLLKTAPKLFKKYSMVGAGAYFMHKNVIERWGMQRKNHKCTNVTGYNVEHLLSVAEKNKTADIWGIDTVHNLSMLTAGYKSVIDFNLLWNTSFDPSDQSGAGAERREKDVLDSFLRMMYMFPGLVRRGKKANHIASFTNVNFMAAYNLFNEPERLQKFRKHGEKLLQEELRFQNRSTNYLNKLIEKYK